MPLQCEPKICQKNEQNVSASTQRIGICLDQSYIYTTTMLKSYTYKLIRKIGKEWLQLYFNHDQKGLSASLSIEMPTTHVHLKENNESLNHLTINY